MIRKIVASALLITAMALFSKAPDVTGYKQHLLAGLGGLADWRQAYSLR